MLILFSLPLRALEPQLVHRYQVYDSLQAFSSSIAGLLASRAVLEGQLQHCHIFKHLLLIQATTHQGVGVGDANASATQALLLTITQDAVSRLASES